MVLKVKAKFVIIFTSNTLFAKFLHQRWFTSFSRIMQWIPLRRNRWTSFCKKWGSYIGISRVTNKRIQPRKVSAVFHHLLYHKIYPRLKFLVSCVTRIRSTFKQLKESVLVMRDRPKMNRNRRSAPLCLNEFLSRSFLRSVTFRD